MYGYSKLSRISPGKCVHPKIELGDADSAKTLLNAIVSEQFQDVTASLSQDLIDTAFSAILHGCHIGAALLRIIPTLSALLFHMASLMRPHLEFVGATSKQACAVYLVLAGCLHMIGFIRRGTVGTWYWLWKR
jgi:hypothetical protein